ncbi:MAG: MFS transporter [Dehalococcoidia bacterium]|nr:MFS transporter [Dehalococcoidia bacterium]
MPPRTVRNLRLLYAFWFLREFQLWIPVWIVFLTLEQGFSLTQVTAAEGLFLVGVVLLEVPTGAVADRWGRSRSLGLGAVCLGASILLFAFTTSFSILLASFLLWSVASTLMSGADMALLFDTLKESGHEDQYERLAGRGHALNWAGAGIATLLGGSVAALLDTRATIFIGAGTCLLTALAAFLVSEPAQLTREHAEHYFRSIGRAFGDVWHATDVRAVVLLAGAAYAAMESVGYVVQPYLLDRGIEVGTLFSLLQVPTILAGTVGALAAARVGGRYGAALALVSIPLLAAGAFATLAVSPGLTAYAALPVIYLLSASLLPIATGYVNRRVSSERRATVLSNQGMVGSLVLAALAPGLGFVTDTWGLPWAFATSGAMALLALALFAPRLPLRNRPPTTTSELTLPAES